jgi:hypothetical protein
VSSLARSALTTAPVVDRLIRRNGIQLEKVVDDPEPLIEMSLGVVPIENRRLASRRIPCRFYQCSSADLSLADSLLLACAGPDDKLAAATVPSSPRRELGLHVIAPPDSCGRRARTD